MERFKLYSGGNGFVRFIAEVGVMTKQVYVHDCIRGITNTTRDWGTKYLKALTDIHTFTENRKKYTAFYA